MNPKNKITYLSLLIGTLLCAGQQQAWAQQDPPQAEEGQGDQDETEVIEVRGIRGSIRESLFIKQSATNVVDAIVAEDIGKFPDQNIAEALQRMTGVTITRNGGEGQNIMVRGLGGDYNVTTLNGRRMASEDSSRNFNYDLIAAELVAGVEVAKSPLAVYPEGGIGSVVDIQTRRPLALGGFTLSGSVKSIYEERTGRYSPQGSFLISDTFADNSFGILLTGAYSERTMRIDSYQGEGFYDPAEGIDVQVPVDSNGNGELDQGEPSYESMIPGYVRYSNWQDTRKRIGASLAMQWRPRDDLEFNFDSLYSSYDTNGSQYQISFVTYDEPWTPGVPSVGDLKFDENGRVNYLQLNNGAMAELLNVSTPRNTTTYQAGLNTKWFATDQLSLELDLSQSEAKSKNSGDNRYVVARGFVDSITIDQTSGNLLPDVTLDPALNADQPFGAHYSYNYGTDIADKVDEVRLAGRFLPDMGPVASLDFGVHYAKQTKTRTQFKSKNPSMFSNGGAYFTNSAYDSFDASSVQQMGGMTLFRLPADVLVPANFDHFLEGEAGKHPAPWASFDYDKLYAFYQSINAQAAEDQIKASLQPKDSYAVGEQTLALYLQANLEGELLALPYGLNLGLRGVRTEVNSSGYTLDLAALRFEEVDKDGTTVVRPVGDISDYYGQFSLKDHYTDWLPSLNFKLNLTDQLLYRFSAAKVLTRPNLDYLTPYSSVDLNQFKYNTSNPGLAPLRANQADTTLEWYFSDYGAATVALFYKDIQSFISYGPRGHIDIDGYSFEVNGPDNDQYGATVKGAELAYQQSFEELLPGWLGGFGVQLNYTYTDSSYEDPDKKAAGLPFEGMSKNAYNAVVYYEKYGLQARLAYNWRSKYLLYPDAWGGPQWMADYGQYDFSAGYDLTDNLSVHLEASNLTNERHWGYIKRPEQVAELSRYGRQFALGISAAF
ncbi:TonB-dependent receptor [Gallaecimonas xiamenensis]|uniref:TonB-dependent receptor n=1 Tax=Gallaecimonas xiamenensis 3-C-1 TaxID=745411 RepID=K2J3D3_9GAMM|nr:TonB-dependent receptor [Gallaecimonas xiamenensis]EKE77526.1 TonB-dependent receptor [Gallaecimonas xiamenensis 3-C-1]